MTKALQAGTGSVNAEEFQIMKELTAAFVYEHPESKKKHLYLVMPPLGESLYSVAPVSQSVESITTLIRTLWH